MCENVNRISETSSEKMSEKQAKRESLHVLAHNFFFAVIRTFFFISSDMLG